MKGATGAGVGSSLKSSKSSQSIEPIRPKYLVVGEILRPHGLRGEVRMRLITDYPDHLATLKSVFVGESADDRNLMELDLLGIRFHKSYALLSLDGYCNRDDAGQLRGKQVLVSVCDAVPLEPGEYYLYQLVGMQVLDRGRSLGLVKEVLQTGANDVYLVQSDQFGEVLVPAHEETIQSIDFKNEVINMTLPDGLLTDE